MRIYFALIDIIRWICTQICTHMYDYRLENNAMNFNLFQYITCFFINEKYLSVS